MVTKGEVVNRRKSLHSQLLQIRKRVKQMMRRRKSLKFLLEQMSEY